MNHERVRVERWPSQAEGSRLLSGCGVLSPTPGSNPGLSAIYRTED